MRKLLLLLPLLLGGCADITTALNPPYEPEVIHLYNSDAFKADDDECKAAGANYKPHFSIGKVAAAAVTGATSNTSLIPVSPLVPAYGAAGGAVGAAADGLDVMSGQHANVYRNCLHDETHWDHSAVLADPRN